MEYICKAFDYNPFLIITIIKLTNYQADST